MARIKVGDIVKIKDFKYLKVNHPDRFLWRMYELSGEETTIIKVNDDGTFIVDKDKDFPITRDMFYHKYKKFPNYKYII